MSAITDIASIVVGLLVMTPILLAELLVIRNLYGYAPPRIIARMDGWLSLLCIGLLFVFGCFGFAMC